MSIGKAHNLVIIHKKCPSPVNYPLETSLACQSSISNSQISESTRRNYHSLSIIDRKFPQLVINSQVMPDALVIHRKCLLPVSHPQKMHTACQSCIKNGHSLLIIHRTCPQLINLSYKALKACQSCIANSYSLSISNGNIHSLSIFHRISQNLSIIHR